MIADEPAGPAIAIVVPALNEADNIAQLVVLLLEQHIDVVYVVDNGSTDDTAAEASRVGATVVVELRRGYGFACAAGSKAAVDNGADIIVFIDGDLSSRPQELPRLVAPIVAGQADLVLGSRALGHIERGAMLPHQRFGNRLSAAMMRVLYGVRVTDLGPYRAIRASLLTSLDMAEMTFGWPTEMTARSVRNGARIIEVPATWSPRHGGRSKVSGTVKGSILAGYHILRVTIRHARFGRR